MRFVRFDPPPALAGFGIATVRDSGALALGLRGPVLTEGFFPVTLHGEGDGESRRRDRYGTLALIAARAAIEQAGLTPDEVAGARCGVALGTTHASSERNTRYALELADPSALLSPALFVRTTSGAAAADVAFALKMGGPGQTFVSGWTAGAEALASAARSVSRGAADLVLAGGVEAPGPLFVRSGAPITEGAALVVVTSDAGAESRRLLAFALGGAASLEAALEAARSFECDTLIVANALADDGTGWDENGEPGRWRPSAASRRGGPAGPRVLRVGDEVGALGAAGAVAGCAMAAEIAGRSLVVARDPHGPIAALVIG